VRVFFREAGQEMTEKVHEVKQGSGLKYVGIGCLSAVGILVVLLIVGGIVVANNWRTWVAAPTRDVMTQAMTETDLPDEQKAAILDETYNFIDAFERGDITMQELGKVAEAFVQSPVVPMLGVYGFGEGYISRSGLSDEEIADANYQLRRVARGISQRTILPGEFNSILEPLEPGPGENPGPRINGGSFDFRLANPENVDDGELREFIVNATTAANEAGVPDEDYQIDYAAEVRKVIETALGRALN
jgi:hypothetical protein